MADAPKFTCPHCGYDEADREKWEKLCDDWRLRGLEGSSLHYILDESRQPVKVCLLRYARWFTGDNKRVAETNTKLFWVSTVFMGLDHNFLGKGPPILFETMVFTRDEHINPLVKHMVKDDLEQWRYATWDDAITGHEAMVRRYQKREEDALARLDRHIKRKAARTAK
jgi:hypothetical protein